MLNRILLASTCCVAALTSVPAYAQAGGAARGDTPSAQEQGKPVSLDTKVAADTSSARENTDGLDIIVTGTRIVRPNNKSAAPISSTTAADIAAQGATTIEEVMNRLPQVQANSEQNYADSDGRQRIKLRNLGFERTLTLVDGLRLGIQNGMDVSIIPTVLVERIDVLSGGASSVYGSDAVAGVINYVLKKDYDGVALTGNYSFYNHNNRANAVTDAATRAFFPARTGMVNDGQRMDLSFTAGKTLFDGAVSISGFVDYRSSQQVSLGDRSISACEVTQVIATGVLNCSRSTYTQVGTIVPQSGALAGRTLVNNPDGSRTFVDYNSGPGTAANPFDDLAFQRDFNRINTGAFLNAHLSENIELYSTALFYRDRSFNTVPNRIYSYTAYGTQPFQVNCANPFLSGGQRTALCGTSMTGTAPLDVRYRFDGLPLVESKFENKGVRISGGLRGKVLDDAWSYDVAGVFSRNTGKTIGEGYPDYDRVNRSLNVVSVGGTPTCVAAVTGGDKACVPFNAFVPFNNDMAANTYLFNNGDGSTGNISQLWQALAILSGDLGKYGITSPLAEQGVAVAFGSESRAESFTSTANAQYRLTTGGRDVSYKQNVFEVNAEAQVPLIDKNRFTDLLQVNAGYRLSKYNKLDGTFNTWKVEGLWAPIADITFRASFNKAQRAPTVIEAVQASNINYVTQGSRNDPCASTRDPNSADPNVRLAATATIEQCRRTGLPDNLYNSAALSCPDGACTIRNGGFQLKPETAYTKTFGVVLRPRFLKGLTLSADRFIINLNDSITYFSAAGFLDGCLGTGLEYYCRGVIRNPGTFTLSSPAVGNPTTGYIAQGTSNGYKSMSHGWDFQSQYTLGLGAAGLLDISLNGSLMTLSGGQGTPLEMLRNCVGFFGPNCGESLPKWKHVMRTSWTSPDKVVNVSVNWRHISPMTLAYNMNFIADKPEDVARNFRKFYTGIEAYDYIDLALSFDIAQRFSLRIAANNLLDRDPPLVPDTRNLLGLLRSNTVFGYDMLGRQIVVGVTTRF
jgi:outer membrane receptor protein involved in Fe transport